MYQAKKLKHTELRTGGTRAALIPTPTNAIGPPCIDTTERAAAAPV